MNQKNYRKIKEIINEVDSSYEKVVLCAYYGILMCSIGDYLAYIKKMFGKTIIAQKEVKEAISAEAQTILSQIKN